MSYEGTAATGIPLVGQGPGNKPKFSTASIAGGGTNATSFSTSNGIVKYDGTRLVTGSATIDSSNITLNTSQPCFMAYNANTVTNVTGDNTVYTCQFDTEVFDNNNNFSSNIFTAPVTGIYLFSVGIAAGNITTQTLLFFKILSTSALIIPLYVTPTSIINGGVIYYTGSVHLRLLASQTCRVQLQSLGGTKTISWLGAALNANPPFFSGCLLC
jgi:hypothetical protein